MNYKELLEFNDYAMDLTTRTAHHSTAIENNPLSLAETISILTTEYIPREMASKSFL
ncbi:hypothetical protein FNE48_03180 [Helicobacter pylori]|nr:hypothetical protein FNE48_03180 [Helicobacter pylori]